VLLRQALYFLNHSASPFFFMLDIFEIGPHFFCPGCPQIVILLCLPPYDYKREAGHGGVHL
jgi:hypothetical protein